MWLKLNECYQKEIISKKKLDLDSKIFGAETTAHSFNGCKNSTEVLFWETTGSRNNLDPNKNLGLKILKFLLAHPKC
jgi:hypothetical protein